MDCCDRATSERLRNDVLANLTRGTGAVHWSKAKIQRPGRRARGVARGGRGGGICDEPPMFQVSRRRGALDDFDTQNSADRIGEVAGRVNVAGAWCT